MHLLIYQEGSTHFARNEKKKRKQEWESHKIALDIMKESKGKDSKQPDKKERKSPIPKWLKAWKKQEMWSEIP